MSELLKRLQTGQRHIEEYTRQMRILYALSAIRNRLAMRLS